MIKAEDCTWLEKLILYLHREDFIKVVSEYVDFSDNKELWRKVTYRTDLEQSILEEGRGGIRVFVIDNLEERIPRERTS